MSTLKILDRKWIIRLFGVALILAPFMNLLFMFYTIKTQNQMTWAEVPFKQILNAGKFSKYLMIVASVVIGAIMLTGSTKAWKAVMLLLFFHVALQIPTIGTDIKQNWLWGPLFLLNVGLLVFIADQLVFRNKTSTPQTNVIALKPPSAEEKSFALTQKITVEFENWGSWAELKSISSTGLVLQQKKTPPPDEIEKKSVDFLFDDSTPIQAHFKFKKDQDYVFEFAPLTQKQSELLNNWLDRKLGS